MSSDLEDEFAKLSIQDELYDPHLCYNPVQRKRACLFYTFEPPYFTDIPALPAEDLHILSQSHKLYLFRQDSRIQEKQAVKGTALLQRLQTISPPTAENYKLKSTAVQDLAFRLLNQRHDPSVREKSYIALSYCWRQDFVPPSASYAEYDEEIIPLPIPGSLFQAFANERISAEEGMWIDALCIDQTSKGEKYLAINAMDTIYRNARVVICALWDITVTPAEERFLRAYIRDFEDAKWDSRIVPHAQEKPPYFLQNPLLKNFLYKMLASRWFTRAWCFHEMRLGKKHVFILPCSGLLRDPSDQNVDRTYLGFTAFFLWHLLRLSSEVPGERSLHHVRDMLAMQFDVVQEVKKQALLTSRDSVSSKTSTDKAGDTGFDDMYTRQIISVFELEAGGDPDLPSEQRLIDPQHDKVSILLNVVRNGLALARNQLALPSSPRNWYYSQTMLLALAANDPVSLCTDGRPLQFGTAEEGLSCFCQPHDQDLGSDPARADPLLPLPSPPITLDLSPLKRWIELDMIFLGTPALPSSDCEEASRNLISECISLNMGLAPGGIFSSWALGPAYQYWRLHTDTTLRMRENFELILACILDCGLNWMLETAKKCGYPKPDALRAAASMYFHEGFNMNELKSGTWKASVQGRSGVEAIFRVANWLAGWRLQGAMSKVDESPVLYTHPRRGKALMFTSIKSPCLAAIPLALINDAYARLARVWFLQPQVSGQDQGLDSAKLRCTLHRKARLYAPFSAEDIEQGPKLDDRPVGRWYDRPQLRVYGPMEVETRPSDGKSHEETVAGIKEALSQRDATS